MKKSCCKFIVVIFVMSVIAISPTYCGQVRNPFLLPSQIKKQVTKNDFTLIATVALNGKCGCIIECNCNSHVVFPGDKLEGYLVANVGENTVTLSKGRESIKLVKD